MRVAPRVVPKAEQRRIQIRDNLWPKADQAVWNRKVEDGFITVPRTLPLIATLIRTLTKDLDASRAYLDLWGRVFDEMIVEINDEEELAASCGYATPRRNVRTWRERIAALEALGFVRVKPKGTRKYGYILLLHPHDVVERLQRTRRKDIPSWWWSLFAKRLGEIGAQLRGRPNT